MVPDQFSWTNHSIYVIQCRGILHKNLSIATFKDFFKFLFFGSRHNIPCLGLAHMQIVQRIHVQVLHMPAETSKFHSEIYPGCGNAAQRLLIFEKLEQWIRLVIYIHQVERVFCSIALYRGESWSISRYWEICGILDLYFLEFLWVLDYVPKFVLIFSKGIFYFNFLSLVLIIFFKILN